MQSERKLQIQKRRRGSMNHIGTIVKQFRCDLGMSRKDLATDICSEKYIYLIEKGERTPSSDLTAALGDKLGTDLFEYYQYMDCSYPLKVKSLFKLFNKYRRTGEYDSLMKGTKEALEYSDFKKEPWSYEIMVNKAAYKVFIEQKHQEVIKEVIEAMEQVKSIYARGEYIANLYVILSTCYQVLGDLDKAKDAVLKAYDIVSNKRKDHRYIQITITVCLNLMTMYYFLKEYTKAIDIGLELIELQVGNESYERAHFSYFYLSYAYYQSGNQEVALMWFTKGLHLINIFDKSMDAYYISSFELFDILMKDERLSIDLKNEYNRKYQSINLS